MKAKEDKKKEKEAKKKEKEEKKVSYGIIPMSAVLLT